MKALLLNFCVITNLREKLFSNITNNFNEMSRSEKVRKRMDYTVIF